MKRTIQCAFIVTATAAGLASPAFAASGSADAALVRSAAALGAGQFAWPDERAPGGAISIVVSIPLQEIFVYRGASLIAVSSVSTGKTGHETPVGNFSIIQKAVTHRSNKYNNAPMPYMERLTWDGVAIHAGYDPGHADSHGCVRVPLAFAKKLYGITNIGARVAIIGDTAAPGLPIDYARVRPPSAVPAIVPAAPAAPAQGDADQSLDPEADTTRAANLAAQSSGAGTPPPMN